MVEGRNSEVGGQGPDALGALWFSFFEAILPGGVGHPLTKVKVRMPRGFTRIARIYTKSGCGWSAECLERGLKSGDLSFATFGSEQRFQRPFSRDRRNCRKSMDLSLQFAEHPFSHDMSLTPSLLLAVHWTAAGDVRFLACVENALLRS